MKSSVHSFGDVNVGCHDGRMDGPISLLEQIERSMSVTHFRDLAWTKLFPDFQTGSRETTAGTYWKSSSYASFWV